MMSMLKSKANEMLPTKALPEMGKALHPAAADAAAAFSDALTMVEKLKAEVLELRATNDALGKHLDYVEKAWAKDRQSLIIWQRYGTQITTSLRTVEREIQEAKKVALEFAESAPQPKEVLEKLEKEIADAVGRKNDQAQEDINN